MDKFFGEREFISPKILFDDAPNLLTIEATPRKLRYGLPLMFFGEYQECDGSGIVVFPWALHPDFRIFHAQFFLLLYIHHPVGPELGARTRAKFTLP